MNKIIYATLILLLTNCNGNIDSETPKLRWNFDTPKEVIYSYKQSVDNESKIGSTTDSEFSKMTIKGYLKVAIKNDSLADVSIYDANMRIISFNQEGKATDTTNHKAPLMVAQNMKTDGSFNDSNTNVMFKLLLPLPTKKLELGEKDDVKVFIPLNINGSRLNTEGFNKLTLTKFDTIYNRKCAVLKSDIDISHLEVPKELKGTYKSATTGTATYYFDIVDGVYVRADIDVEMKALIHAKGDNNNSRYWETVSQNTFSIRLKDIEQ